MPRADFLAALEQELQRQAVPFSRADLLAFVADMWPLVEEDPDATLWAKEFIESGRARMTA